MSGTVDTILTIVLFVALIPGVFAACAIGFHLIMLGDKASPEHPRRSTAGLIVGVFGVPLSAIIIYITAGALAWTSSGYTFYFPLIALAVGAGAVVGLSALADWIISRR